MSVTQEWLDSLIRLGGFDAIDILDTDAPASDITVLRFWGGKCGEHKFCVRVPMHHEILDLPIRQAVGIFQYEIRRAIGDIVHVKCDVVRVVGRR